MKKAVGQINGWKGYSCKWRFQVTVMSLNFHPNIIDANPKNLKCRRHFYESTFVFLFRFTLTLHYLQKLSTLPTMLIVDGKSGRFMYQSRRAGDEAKRRKSPTKSRRVGISVIWSRKFYFYHGKVRG